MAPSLLALVFMDGALPFANLPSSYAKKFGVDKTEDDGQALGKSKCHSTNEGTGLT